MKQIATVIGFQLLALIGFSQDKPAYQLFTGQGKKVTYQKMMKQLERSDILLFGELHDNPIAHWLQLEVTTDLHQIRTLILGAEMMEADNQDELDAYLQNQINADTLAARARLWSNYDTDYAPLIDFAKANQLPFVATNIPRRYARAVFLGGFEALDTLSKQEKDWIAPLPIPFDPDLPTYQNILTMMGDHGTPELVKAQAIKDATMAYFILKNRRPGSTFIHYNGAYHSDFYEGILWYLRQKEPVLGYRTISTVSQADLGKLEKEHFGKADFIIVVDAEMTTTY